MPAILSDAILDRLPDYIRKRAYDILQIEKRIAIASLPDSAQITRIELALYTRRRPEYYEEIVGEGGPPFHQEPGCKVGFYIMGEVRAWERAIRRQAVDRKQRRPPPRLLKLGPGVAAGMLRDAKRRSTE